MAFVTIQGADLGDVEVNMCLKLPKDGIEHVRVHHLKEAIVGAKKFSRALRSGTPSVDRLTLLTRAGGSVLPDSARVFPFVQDGTVHFHALLMSTGASKKTVGEEKSVDLEDKGEKEAAKPKPSPVRAEDVDTSELKVDEEAKELNVRISSLALRAQMSWHGKNWRAARSAWQKLVDKYGVIDGSSGVVRRVRLTARVLGLRGLALCMMSQGRFSKAVELQREARDLGDSSACLAMETGEALLGIGKSEARTACSLFERAIALHKREGEEQKQFWECVSKRGNVLEEKEAKKRKADLAAGRPEKRSFGDSKDKKAERIVQAAAADALATDKWSLGLRVEWERSSVVNKAGASPILGLAHWQDQKGIQVTETDAVIGIVRAMQLAGRPTEAAAALNTVIKQGENHVGVLLEYSKIVRQRAAAEAAAAAGSGGSSKSTPIAPSKAADAVTSAVKAIVLRSDDKAVRRNLVEALVAAGGDATEILTGIIPKPADADGKDGVGEGGRKEGKLSSTAEGGASAIAFLGDAVRDYGAAESAVSLLEDAVSRAPNVPQLALSLAHALELLGEYGEAIGVIRDFFERNKEAVIRSKPSRRGDGPGEIELSLGELADALRPGLIPSDVFAFARAANVPCPPTQAAEASEFAARLGVRETFQDRHRRAADIAAEHSSGSSKPMWGRTTDGRTAALRNALRPPSDHDIADAKSAVDASLRLAPPTTIRWVSEPPPHAVIGGSGGDGGGEDDGGGEGDTLAALQTEGRFLDGKEAHDVVALGATAVKILYVAGCFVPCLGVIRLIERVRCGVPLHLTNVRNELAYYTCIVQTLAMHAASPTLSLPSTPHARTLGSTLSIPSTSCRPLFFIGDSHVIPAAWSSVQVGEESRLLVPALVTGIKAWHLRKDSLFYPRINFEAVAGRIPRGAEAVVCIGEIDCREGIPAAVRKLRYKDEDAGIANVVSILVDVLISFAAKLSLKLYIHPVPPVLEPTRSTVSKFNATLRTAVHRDAASRLHWLDLEPALHGSDTDKTTFNPELEFDGTHLNPNYVSALGKAISEVAKEEREGKSPTKKK